MANAAEFVATITAYNKAELSGEVPANMSVSFENTNHSKGQITAGNIATMTISDFPKGAITRVVVYVKSNASSGAGSLNIEVDKTHIAGIQESNFCDWSTAGYSSSYVPIIFEGFWQTAIGSELVCLMTASVNSLTWEKVVISFMEASPDPKNVTLKWFDKEGNTQTKTISELSGGAGVTLPDCDIKSLVADGTWIFAGWTAAKVTAVYPTAPAYFKPGEKYYPEDDITLYALYYQDPEVAEVVQTTSFHTGEYAMVMHLLGAYYMAYGAVEGGHIDTEPCEIELRGDLYTLSSPIVPAAYRYSLAFDNNGVQIRHIDSGKIIGYTSASLSSEEVSWMWQENIHHSVMCYYDAHEVDGKTDARVLWLSLGDETPYFESKLVTLGSTYEFILLFDVSAAPTTNPSAKWTGNPFGGEGIETIWQPQAARKVMQNGKLYIEYNHTKYDVLGHKISE